MTKINVTVLNLVTEAEFSSVGGAPATYVEAVVLAAGDPGSNPAPSGPILCVIAPYFLSISTNLSIKGKNPKKIYFKKKKKKKELGN